MSQGSRTALILAAVAVLVGGFFVARGSDSDDDDDEPTATATTPIATAPAATTTVETTATTPPPPPPPPVPTIRVEGGQPVGGVKTLRFDKGDRIRFRVRSDVAEEVHVHGFDVAKDVAAGGSVTFSFEANIDGKYEVELEHSAVQIASLSISP